MSARDKLKKTWEMTFGAGAGAESFMEFVENHKKEFEEFYAEIDEKEFVEQCMVVNMHRLLTIRGMPGKNQIELSFDNGQRGFINFRSSDEMMEIMKTLDDNMASYCENKR